MSDENTRKFTKEVLLHMRERLSDYQEKYEGELFNLEATPAESTAYRLAKHDRKRWPDIKTAGKKGDTPYYTNSSHLPVEYTTDILMHWIFRMNCRHCIHQELYSMHLSVRSFLTGKQQPHWCVRLQRIINCRITPFPRHIRYVRNMDISAVSISPVRNVARRQKFTAVSPDITDRYRTGMTVRLRNIRTVHSMM